MQSSTPESRTLIVTAHPDPESLTHLVAGLLQAELGASSAELAHLAQEGFDPRFTLADRRTYQGLQEPGEDVRAEQRRLDAVTDLVLVFPVYWWSMPALLKGWIDRVFLAGWAFDISDSGAVIPRLERLRVHVLPISATAEASFERHGYGTALRTQLHHGVLDYCGARRGATAFLRDSESLDADGAASAVESVVRAVADAVRSTP